MTHGSGDLVLESVTQSPFEKLSSDFMALFKSRCEELGAPRCGALQVPRDEAGAVDNATRRVALQAAHTSSSGSDDAKASPSALFLA